VTDAKMQTKAAASFIKIVSQLFLLRQIPFLEVAIEKILRGSMHSPTHLLIAYSLTIVYTLS